jgi:hypothetical protein
LKIVICIGIGYAITKKGMFPPAGAKGVSILSLVGHTEVREVGANRILCQNVGLPALIFSSMVTAFNDDNIAAFGSLVPVAILYQCLGALMALFISEVFYVPNDFKWGILVVSLSRCLDHVTFDANVIYPGWRYVKLGWDSTATTRKCMLMRLAGNLPIAVVQTMAAGEPFNGTTDVQLGVAYISYVFIPIGCQ